MMTSLSVLVVDDSLIMQKKIAGMLTELGLTVIACAATGVEAVRLYRERRPDLVTMDITMPDMDGITATGQIIAEFPSALIVMVTSHGQEAMMMSALDAGAKGYVLKPLDRERFAAALDKIKAQYF
jgi:two-component system chemotaxis response regulator CheY